MEDLFLQRNLLNGGSSLQSFWVIGTEKEKYSTSEAEVPVDRTVEDTLYRYSKSMTVPP